MKNLNADNILNVSSNGFNFNKFDFNQNDIKILTDRSSLTSYDDRQSRLFEGLSKEISFTSSDRKKMRESAFPLSEYLTKNQDGLDVEKLKKINFSNLSHQKIGNSNIYLVGFKVKSNKHFWFLINLDSIKTKLEAKTQTVKS